VAGVRSPRRPGFLSCGRFLGWNAWTATAQGVNIEAIMTIGLKGIGVTLPVDQETTA